MWLTYNWQLENTKDSAHFEHLIQKIITEFPHTKNYFKFWLSEAIAHRAFPALTKIPKHLFEVIWRHTNDLEWMHKDIQAKNYGITKNSSVDEVIQSLFRYSNSLYEAEEKALQGVKVVRKRYRSNKTGDESTRGPDTAFQLTRPNKHNIFKRNVLKDNVRFASN